MPWNTVGSECGSSSAICGSFYSKPMLLLNTSIYHFPFRTPPTKLLCFTRSSILIHQLPTEFPSSVFAVQVTEDAKQTLHDLVFPSLTQLVVCKLSTLLSQSSVQELLREFVQSDITQVSSKAPSYISFLCTFRGFHVKAMRI